MQAVRMIILLVLIFSLFLPFVDELFFTLAGYEIPLFTLEASGGEELWPLVMYLSPLLAFIAIIVGGTGGSNGVLVFLAGVIPVSYFGLLASETGVNTILSMAYGAHIHLVSAALAILVSVIPVSTKYGAK